MNINQPIYDSIIIVYDKNSFGSIVIVHANIRVLK